MNMLLNRLPLSIIDRIITFLPSRLTFSQKIEYMEVLGMKAHSSEQIWNVLPIETRQIHLKNEILCELVFRDISADFVILYDTNFGAYINLFDSLSYHDFNRALYQLAESRDITMYDEDLDPFDYVELDPMIKNIYQVWFGGKRFIVYHTHD